MVLQAIQYTPALNNAGSSLQILDQLALPYRSTYLSIRNCEDAHKAIKQMKVRGAPAIAIVAALALAVELGHPNVVETAAEDTVSSISKKLDYLKSSRPTAVNLGDAVGKLRRIVKDAAVMPHATGNEVAEAYTSAAERMLIDDVSDNKAIGDHGSRWIRENTPAGRKREKGEANEMKILTHCNTGSLATAGYGTALGVIRSLHASNFLTRAYCTETRPYNQGSRLTAFELVHDQIPATLVTDSMAAALLAREGDKIAAVVVGADRVAANGDTANKIGTYSLAVLARHHGIKFLVAAPRTTIDLATKSGRDIEVEERVPEEVSRIRGPIVGGQGHVMSLEDPVTINVAAEGIDIWNPAFDITPAALIDGVVTEVGVVEKDANGQFDFNRIFKVLQPNGTS